jgi:hypothetical protein
MTQLTPEQIAAIKLQIDGAATIAEQITGTVAPQYVPLIILGQIVADAIPGAVADIQNMIAGNAPSDADVQALWTKIGALGNPESI